MIVLEINSVNYGSTGNIMMNVADQATNEQHIVYTACAKSRSNGRKSYTNQILIGSTLSRNIHLKLATLAGKNGCYSKIATNKFLRILDKIEPDIIHLHNLHNCYINLPMLFNYIKKHNIPIVWTLHDCWAFTGQCPHFTMAKCEKWKKGCYDCPQYRQYPASYVDRTKTMWKLKKKWFTGVQNMTIVTPSQWLADLVKVSYLKDYPVKVIYNGIDLTMFKPTESNFRERYGIPAEKKILLGVAFGWGKRKGLDVFMELANRLDKETYQIILVGTDDAVDAQLSKSIISIHRTQDQRELAEIYTAADLFVNPTREEVLGLVNVEALACGTPVITFKSGGSPECIDETCGSVVACDDVDKLEIEIMRICSDNPYSKEACLERAKAFDMNERFDEYIKLYEEKR